MEYDMPPFLGRDAAARYERWRRESYSSTIATGAAIYVATESLKRAEQMLASLVSYGGKEFVSLEPILSEVKKANEILGKKEYKFGPEKKEDLKIFQAKIVSYRDLITKKASEPDFQKFFGDNPVFLSPFTKSVFPKKSFGGEDFPDFVLILDDGSCMLVEIENPNKKLYTKREDPAADLSHAEEQIRGYLAFAKEEKDFLRKRGMASLTVENVTGLIVIGSNLSEKEKARLMIHNSVVRGNYIIKTFDRVLEENQSLLVNLREIEK